MAVTIGANAAGVVAGIAQVAAARLLAEAAAEARRQAAVLRDGADAIDAERRRVAAVEAGLKWSSPAARKARGSVSQALELSSRAAADARVAAELLTRLGEAIPA